MDDLGPAALRAAESTDFLAGCLPAPPARILDVGCGPGDIARTLIARGHPVVAIDVDPVAVQQARAAGVPAVQADVAEYHDDPFDAVLFSMSLHHVAHLDRALRRVRSLLGSGGLLVIDEFAWDAADRATATWFYDTADLLHATGLLPAYRPAPGDGLRRWTTRHRDDDPMHTGEEMLRHLSALFEVHALQRAPYLHRYLGGWLTEDAPGARTFAALRRIEDERVADGTLARTGLRLLAR